MDSPYGIAYTVKESHMEGGVRVIDRFELLWVSLMPPVVSEADSQQDSEGEHDSQHNQK